MNFHTASLSRTGGRKNNQDYCGFMLNKEMGLWVVADGMGGHIGGEVASRTATETILDYFSSVSAVTEENMLRLMMLANEQVRKGQRENPQYSNMQTTMVLIMSNEENTILANIGDSRCYYLSNGIIKKRTFDHSVPQLLVKTGEIREEEVRFHPDRNKVLKSIGKDDNLKPDITIIDHPLQPKDAFLLCSDGFWELLTEEEMAVDFVKSTTPEEWLQKMELRLLRRMTKHHDNYSAVAVFYQ